MLAMLSYNAIAAAHNVPIEIDNYLKFPIGTSLKGHNERDMMETAPGQENNSWGMIDDNKTDTLGVTIVLPGVGGGLPICPDGLIHNFHPRDYGDDGISFQVYGKVVKDALGNYDLSGVKCGFNIM